MSRPAFSILPAVSSELRQCDPVPDVATLLARIERLERRVVALEQGVPVPKRTKAGSILGQLRSKIKAMKIGDSFPWQGTAQHPYLAAHQVGAKLRREKQEYGWRFWKIENPSPSGVGRDSVEP